MAVRGGLQAAGSPWNDFWLRCNNMVGFNSGEAWLLLFLEHVCGLLVRARYLPHHLCPPCSLVGCGGRRVLCSTPSGSAEQEKGTEGGGVAGVLGCLLVPRLRTTPTAELKEP